MTKTLRLPFIALALVAMPALSSATLVVTIVDPGTTPVTLGSYTLTAFQLDPQGSLVTSVNLPFGGTLDFSIQMDHANSSGTDWYSYFATGSADWTVQITLPSGTGAFYFYANPFERTQGVSVSATVNSLAASTTQAIHFGSPGFFGFYGTAGETISTIDVTVPFPPNAEYNPNIAIGSFGIATVTQTSPPPGPAAIPEPSSLSLLALGALALGVRRRSRRQ